jgi:hypothetical protein
MSSTYLVKVVVVREEQKTLHQRIMLVKLQKENFQMSMTNSFVLGAKLVYMLLSVQNVLL